MYQLGYELTKDTASFTFNVSEMNSHIDVKKNQ